MMPMWMRLVLVAVIGLVTALIALGEAALFATCDLGTGLNAGLPWRSRSWFKSWMGGRS